MPCVQLSGGAAQVERHERRLSVLLGPRRAGINGYSAPECEATVLTSWIPATTRTQLHAGEDESR